MTCYKFKYSHWWKIYFSKKNPLQDLLSSVNAVISTNEVKWLINRLILKSYRQQPLVTVICIIKKSPSTFLLSWITIHLIWCIEKQYMDKTNGCCFFKIDLHNQDWSKPIVKWYLKVRQSCNVFFKPTILPKNERMKSFFFA